MAKYTQQEIKELANLMRREAAAGRPVSFLTGAGCSLSAGVPLASMIVETLCQNELGEHIRRVFGKSKPTAKDYGRVMGCLTLNERKDFFDPILKNARVNFGHIALACLMKAGYVGRVLTFNFDAVLAHAAGICGFYPATYDFGVSPANTFDHIVVPCILHLHGQGHGQSMMNSEEETRLHAEKLRPLFDDTLQNTSIVVVGYSGEADQAFNHFKSAFRNQRRLTWCDFETGARPEHIGTLLDKAKQTANYLQGVAFDVFTVQLAQELRCFPPTLFESPAEHLLEEIKDVMDPPDDLQPDGNLIDDLRAKLTKWKNSQQLTSKDNIRQASLRGDLDSVVAFSSNAKTQEEKDIVAWAFLQKGINFYAVAQENTHPDVNLLKDAIIQFKAALSIKPKMFEALEMWGWALYCIAWSTDDRNVHLRAAEKFRAALVINPKNEGSLRGRGWVLLELAGLKLSEEMYAEAAASFELAFQVKSKNEDALTGLGFALSSIGSLKNDTTLYLEAISKFEAANHITPNNPTTYRGWIRTLGRLYSLTKDAKLLSIIDEKITESDLLLHRSRFSIACAYALIGRESECKRELVLGKANKTLPNIKRISFEKDLQVYWNKKWFKALLK